MQEDTSFRGDVIGLCISIKGRHTEGKGRHQRGLSSSLYNYYLELHFCLYIGQMRFCMFYFIIMSRYFRMLNVGSDLSLFMEKKFYAQCPLLAWNDLQTKLVIMFCRVYFCVDLPE